MFIRWWGSTAYSLPLVSRRSNTIGGFRSPLFRWVLVFREVWFQVVRSVVFSIDSLSGWTTRTGLHRTIAEPRFMIGWITTAAILLLSVISDKVLCVKYLRAVPLQHLRHELDVWPWSPISQLIKYIKILRTSDWPEGDNFSSNTSAKSQHECKVVTRAVKTIRPLRLLKCEVHFFQDRCFFSFHSDLGRLFRAQNEELILLYSESNEV